MNNDFRLEYDDPARPLRRFIAELYLNPEVGAIMREYALPDECAEWIAAGAHPSDFADLMPTTLGCNLDGIRADEVYLPESVTINERFFKKPVMPNYGTDSVPSLHQVEVEVDVVERFLVPVDDWLSEGRWPDPEQFLHRPYGWDWEEEEMRCYPLSATYAGGEASLEFGVKCPEFAPAHSPKYFEKLVYSRGKLTMESKVVPDGRRAAEWRFIINTANTCRLVTPEGVFETVWVDLRNRRDAYVYWAGRQIAYGDMDYRF